MTAQSDGQSPQPPPSSLAAPSMPPTAVMSIVAAFLLIAGTGFELSHRMLWPTRWRLDSAIAILLINGVMQLVTVMIVGLVACVLLLSSRQLGRILMSVASGAALVLSSFQPLSLLADLVMGSGGWRGLIAVRTFVNLVVILLALVVIVLLATRSTSQWFEAKAAMRRARSVAPMPETMSATPRQLPGQPPAQPQPPDGS